MNRSAMCPLAVRRARITGSAALSDVVGPIGYGGALLRRPRPRRPDEQFQLRLVDLEDVAADRDDRRRADLAPADLDGMALDGEGVGRLEAEGVARG